MLFVCHPKFSISIVFSFSWGHFNSQEKLKTKLMQNFGVTNKEHYGMLWYFWSGQLLVVVKGFSKDLVLVRTAQAIRSRKIVIRLNGSGYPLEKIVIRSDGSGYPFERLEPSVQNNCQPRYCSNSPSPEPSATKL